MDVDPFLETSEGTCTVNACIKVEQRHNVIAGTLQHQDS